MHNLLLLGVLSGLGSLEPLLLIGIGMAAGWVWGMYWSSVGREQQRQLVEREVGSMAVAGSSDAVAETPEHGADACGSTR
jgi:hypothetical protein